MKLHLLHKWTKWEQYLWEGKVGYGRIGVKENDPPKMTPVTERRQKRHCEICGYEQDRVVNYI